MEYPQESAGTLMETNVPKFFADQTVSEVVKLLAQGKWEDIHSIYIVDQDQKLQGSVSIHKLFTSSPNQNLKALSEKPKLTVNSKKDQEKVVIEAVKNDLKSIPVVDDEGVFLGIVTAEKIIGILHQEHLEDFLRSSGIRGRGSKIIELITDNIFDLLKSRLPWLMVGLFVGLAVSLMTSKFETSLRENIALVFFMPLIAYMSDAIGTQTETIFIRAQTLLKLNTLSYIIKELILGSLIGSILGVIAGVFAYFLSGSVSIAFVVGISLLLSMTVATVLACVTPVVLKNMGKDPAVGSGPFTTALQDLVSLTIYLIVATIIL